MMSQHKWIQPWVSGVIVAGLVSCTSPSPPPPVDGSTAPRLQAPTSTVVTVTPAQIITKEKAMSSGPLISPPLDPGPQQFVRQAQENLARRFGVPVDGITVGAVIGQEFSTDAFYCRTTKGRIARDESPAVMSGWSILLSASGRRYEYHASGQTVIFCRPLP